MTLNGSSGSSLPEGEANGSSFVRLVAFYLPQFHPIKENDEWWGRGFTEWTNVTKAEPLFPGHHQPQLPTDLGFYDLRLREVRREQIRLAKSYGIDAFCYHYYWFSGKRLLEAPLEDMLKDPESDMPFCLCWANENWSRRWNGGEQDVLIEQKYRSEDAQEFIRDVTRYLSDARYLRVDGKPLLIVYRAQEIPDVHAAVNVWRKHCRAVGIGEIHLCAALTFGNFNYSQFGFDSGVEFPPHNRTLLGVNCINGKVRFHRAFKGCAMMFHELASAYLNRNHDGQNIFRGVLPSWDNTARSQERALFFLNGTPRNYEFWLSQTIRLTRRRYPNSDRLVFINAWNEWAEGCHLEPDRKFNRDFLEATLRAKKGRTMLTGFPDIDVPEEATVNLRSFFGDLKEVIQRHAFLLLRRGYNVLEKMLARTPRLKRLLKGALFGRRQSGGV